MGIHNHVQQVRQLASTLLLFPYIMYNITSQMVGSLICKNLYTSMPSLYSSVLAWVDLVLNVEPFLFTIFPLVAVVLQGESVHKCFSTVTEVVYSSFCYLLNRIS